jgi:hypothetical protein
MSSKLSERLEKGGRVNAGFMYDLLIDKPVDIVSDLINEQIQVRT